MQEIVNVMTTKFQPYTKYKDSAVEWLQNIPSEWMVNRGKFCFKNHKKINSTMSCDNVLSLTMKGVIHRDELGEGGLLPTSYDTFQIFEKNDLVFKLIDLDNYKTSRVGIVPERGIMSSAYIRLQAKGKNIEPRYFYWFYYNLYLQGIYNFLGMGVRSTLSPWSLLEMPILIPDKKTQERIADFLDRKTENIDKTISKKQKLIELLKGKRSSIIAEMVTRGTNSNAKLKDSGIEWVGLVPDNWEINPGFIYISETTRKNVGLKEKNLLSLSYGEIVNKEISSNFGLLPATFETYQIVYPGQIIFRLTDLQNDKKSLRSGIVKQKGIITSAYVAIKANEKFFPEYLNYLFRTYDARKVFYNLGSGVRQSSDFKELKKLPLVVPPKEEQKNIVKLLDKSTNEIDKSVKEISYQIKQLCEYRASLIYNAVTGKIKI